ncbi:MAG: hypothetical protein P1V35_08245 [Planctomycetota bacterium]|nr:hypothetical protein [Planctomycetota bacterium]
MRSMVVRRLRERCLLLDPHGVSVQVLASIADAESALSGDRPGGEGGFSFQSSTAVAAAVERVIDDCASGVAEVPLAGFPRGGVLSQLAGALKVNPAELRRACDRFNGLPASARRAFHALVLQRRSLESACRRSAAAAELWSQGAARGLKEIVGSRRDGTEDPQVDGGAASMSTGLSTEVSTESTTLFG